MPRLLVLLVVPLLVLAGCSSTGAAGATDGRIRVVASTNVWGDIARQVGGGGVQVVSLINDPSRDPHDFQADVRDQLTVSRARLVVQNGGGYDDFLTRLRQHTSASTRTVDAVAASGLDRAPSTGAFNEHVWYDVPAVSKVAGRIAEALTSIDPAQKALFTSRLQRFRSRLHGLERTEAEIRRAAAGKGVAITEPVPLYLTAALGLVNRTPAAFSHAVEEGSDVAPALLRDQLALLSGHRVAVLAYNEQTAGATTDQVLAAAAAAGVPVVGARETLPEGKDYVQWIQQDLAAMRAAVGG